MTGTKLVGARTGRRGTAIVLAIAAGLLLLYFAPAGMQTLKALLLDHCVVCYKTSSAIYNTVLASEIASPLFYLVVAAVIAVELLLPAGPGQKALSPGTITDAAWFLLDIFAMSAMAGLYIHLLQSGYESYLGFLRVDAVSTWPLPLQIGTVVLAGDFLAWLQHYIKHKVPLFWCFHSVHHSQREMNLFTNHRAHPVDRLLTHSIRYLPLLSVTPSAMLPTALAWSLFKRWHLRVYHANIRLNYGVLRYLLVTPQSHRIHHSSKPEHQDKNFGQLFSIWDYLFGTQYRHYDEYPPTGVQDRQFPVETGARFADVVVQLGRQLIYPFRLAATGGASGRETPATGD